jgi:ADP-heptose:LPS heptosyltransferase
MELARFKKIDFFPPWRESLDDLRSICIATKSRNLGDALALSTLPEKLKAKYPHLRISTYPRGFNPVVFENNPAVERIDYLPDAIYGDDTNLGTGQLIHLKERFFALPLSPSTRAKLHLSEEEIRWRDRLLAEKLLPKNVGKPLCILHPWGSTRNRVLPVKFWDKLVEENSDRYRFWQAGVFGHPAVVGCEYYLFLKPRPGEARKLFSIMSAANKFIGVDSGPMHVARAFDIPSLVLLNHASGNDIPTILKRRDQEPYFINGNWIFSPLYSDNLHLSIPALPVPGDLTSAIQNFLTAIPSPFKKG